MRDFHNGGDINVVGDFHITDSSTNDYKPLAHCSTEELLEERPFRKGNLKLEFRRKLYEAIPALGTAVLGLIGAAIWAQLNGHADLVAFILGIGSLLVGFAALNTTLEPNDFELHERDTLAEIHMILRSRRVE